MGKIKFFNPVVFQKGSTPSIDDFASTQVPDNSYLMHPYAFSGYFNVDIYEPGIPTQTLPPLTPNQWGTKGGSGTISDPYKMYLAWNPYAWTRGLGPEGATGSSDYPYARITNRSSATILAYCNLRNDTNYYFVLAPGESSSWQRSNFGFNAVYFKVWVALKAGGIFSLKKYKKMEGCL